MNRRALGTCEQWNGTGSGALERGTAGALEGHMATAYLRCGTCGRTVAAGIGYCPHCGEAVDPALVNKLRDMHATLQLLDARIADGWADRTLADLRADLVEQYLALRMAPSAPAVPVAPVAPVGPAASPVARETSAPAQMRAELSRDARGAGVGAAKGDVSPAAGAAVRVPAGPAFSWRAFVAEQAIAIMAYLGGFLLLVATLAFEVGGWQELPNGIKLAVVSLVYVVFGALGILLRRSVTLGTVGRAYLGVFALMTPLVALAVYRFELQALGFPVAGMLCISALYATAIFLLLAARTDFATYAYVGWTALAVAALAGVDWSGNPREWSFFALGAVSIVLLLPTLVRRMPQLAALRAPALHLAAVTSVIAALGTLALTGVGVLYSMGIRYPHIGYTPDAFASAGVVLWLLSLTWSRVTHGGALNLSAELLDLVDWLTVALAPIGVVGVLMWAGAERALVAPAVALVALLTLVVALVLRRRQPERTRLRFAQEGLAVALTALAGGIVYTLPAPNWSLAAVLAAGIAVTVTVAAIEDVPWVLLASGLFVSIEYRIILAATLPTPVINTSAEQDAAQAMVVSLMLGFAVALGLVGTGLTLGARAKAFAWPVLLTALANALIVLPLEGWSLSIHVVFFATLAALALIAGYRLQRPVWAGLVTAFFGGLAMWVIETVPDRPGETVVAALGMAVLALAIRRWLGRTWAFGPYALAVWGALVGWAVLNQLASSLAGEPIRLIGIKPGDWLLLAAAVLATGAALLENIPWTMAAPAALAFAALVHGSADPRPQVAIALALVGAGMLLRRLRGQWWSVAWHVAGFGGALLAVRAFGEQPFADPRAQIAVLLAFAALAYLVALQERSVWVTGLSAAFAALAAQLVPLGQGNLVPTLALTFGYALAGSVLSRWRGGTWALGTFAAAVFASLLAVIRLTPFDPGVAEALLLVFAGASYLVAVLERRAWASGVPALYAMLAVVVQPDSHALLPLALALAVAALVVSRLGGWQRAWPLYAGAATAAAATALLGAGAANTGFEALALLALALAAYAIAALESRIEVIPVALLFGVLALAAGSGARQLPELVSTLAYVALSWLYVALAAVWRRLPGLRARGAWWSDSLADRVQALQRGDPRVAGAALHEWGGLAVGATLVVAALFAPDALAARAPGAQSLALALVSLAGLCWLRALLHRQHWARYVAGGLLALAVSAEARWAGAANVQAFILAPGSYLVVAGALLSADARLGRQLRLGRVLSLAGAIVLLAPTLAQSFADDPAWAYALVLALEALLLAGAGVGIRSRILVLTSSVFVAVAALRGAALAVTSGVPIALVIALLALLLMGGATWLSLRMRHDAGQAA